MNQFFRDNQISSVSFKDRATKIRLVIILVVVILGIIDVVGATQMSIPSHHDDRTLTAGYRVTAKQAKNIANMPTSVTVDRQAKFQYGAISPLRPAKVIKKKNPNYDPHVKMPNRNLPTKKFMAKLQQYEASRDKYQETLKFTGGPSLRFVMVSQKTGRSTMSVLPLISRIDANPLMTISRLSRHHYFGKIRIVTEVRQVRNDKQIVKSSHVDGFKQPTWKLTAAKGKHTVNVTYGYTKSTIQRFATAKNQAIGAAVAVWLGLVLFVWVFSGIFVTGARAANNEND